MFAYEMYTFDPSQHAEESALVDFMGDPEAVEWADGYATKFLAVKHALDAMDDYMGENPDQCADCLWCLIVEYSPRPTVRDAWTEINWRDFNSIPPMVSTPS